jgi:hypothetical protein
VNSDKEGVLKVALGKLVVGVTTDVEAVEMRTMSVVVKDTSAVPLGTSEDVVKNSVSVSVSAGTADDAVEVGSATAVDWRTRLETPYPRAHSASSRFSRQQYVPPVVSEVQ